MNKTHTILFLSVFLLASCSHVNEKCNNSDKNDHASRFQIIDYKFFKKIIVVNPWEESVKDRFEYYLFDKDAIVPDSIPTDKVIRVPVKRIICMSTTHLAMTDELGESETVAGISGRNLIYNTSFIDKIDKGIIYDVGYESNLNKELVISLKPDLLMTYGIDPSSAGYMEKLKEMGVKIMYNADYLEETPLARAEWIKVFGALFKKEKKAESVYDSLVLNYRRICDSISSLSKSKPMVMFGGPWENIWYVAPTNSYAIKLVTDAGGDYFFSDLVAANPKPYPVETVFVKSMKADVWLNPGSARSLNELFSFDYRFKSLPVSSNGRIFNNNKRLSPDGGNDYWESAVIHPDVLLRDIASILHPELYPGYKPVYYRKLQ